jgi:hypothetical protein
MRVELLNKMDFLVKKAIAGGVSGIAAIQPKNNIA